MTQGTATRLWWLALLATALPFLTIHASFLVSALEGHVRWCFPYWETCTSISRTGRQGTGYFIFKGGMLPATVLLALYWGLNRRWLQSLGLATGQALPWLGLVSSLSLLMYTVALGHAGDAFHLMRRVGVVGWFGLTWIAQLQLGAALQSHPRWHRQGRRLLQLSLGTLAIALASLVVGVIMPERHDELENAFEWMLALLLNLHGFAVVWLWRASAFSLTTRAA